MRHLRWTPYVWLLACAVVPLTRAGASAQSSKPPQASDEQLRIGKGLFLQNCSVCHFPTKTNPKNPAEAGTSVGPSLAGLLGTESGMSEQSVRGVILRGFPEKMPGFRYGLKANEIDDIVAYLKTL